MSDSIDKYVSIYLDAEVAGLDIKVGIRAVVEAAIKDDREAAYYYLISDGQDMYYATRILRGEHRGASFDIVPKLISDRQDEISDADLKRYRSVFYTAHVAALPTGKNYGDGLRLAEEAGTRALVSLVRAEAAKPGPKCPACRSPVRINWIRQIANNKWDEVERMVHVLRSARAEVNPQATYDVPFDTLTPECQDEWRREARAVLARMEKKNG